MASTKSTKIDDLPGPEVTQYEHQEPPSNITVNVSKKRVSFADETDTRSLWGIIKDEINEENALIALLLFMAALPSVTSHFKTLPLIGAYASNDVMTGVVTSGVFILLFVLVKVYLLPRIKL